MPMPGEPYPNMYEHTGGKSMDIRPDWAKQRSKTPKEILDKTGHYEGAPTIKDSSGKPLLEGIH